MSLVSKFYDYLELFTFIVFKVCVCVWVCAYVGVHRGQRQQIVCTGGRGSCELPAMGSET